MPVFSQLQLPDTRNNVTDISVGFVPFRLRKLNYYEMDFFLLKFAFNRLSTYLIDFSPFHENL